jgi:hypothetical protein
MVKRKQSARNEWDLALLEKFSKHPLLSSIGNAQSRRAMRYFYSARRLCMSIREITRLQPQT